MLYTTNLVGSYTFNNLGRTIQYTYDASGNIATRTDTANGVSTTTEYFYDELNQLIRENDPVANKTITYTYDNGGNILVKREYAYTTGALGSATKTINYGYGNSEWKDLLTSYRGLSIEYDRVGNPLTFDGATLTWEQGRKLSSITMANGATVSYKYDANGVRTQKTVAGVTTDYFLQGSTIVAQKTGNNVIWYYFDGDGTRDAIEYNGTVYYYMYNPQGDVIGLFDDNLNVVVEYTYDSWGKILSITGSLASTLGQDNPFRYRGYYYDNETGLYYLNSRYYHPEIGRFINADGYVQTGQGLLDKNMFAYCLNNPVNRIDANGENSDAVKLWATTMSWLCFVDSLLPIGDMVYWGGLLLLTAGCAAGVAIAQPSISTPKVEEKEAEKDVVIDIPKEQDKGTKIYRYGGTNPSNLTPKEKDKKTGLSFSTIPQPGAAVTTIEELNATGIVFAVQDGPYHVSVIPVNGTVQDWIDAGTDSIWTHAVKSSVIKWDGVN